MISQKNNNVAGGSTHARHRPTITHYWLHMSERGSGVVTVPLSALQIEALLLFLNLLLLLLPR